MKKLLAKSNFTKAIERPLFAARYLKGKVKANLGYRFGQGYSLSPGRVFFALTGRCNLKCEMCQQYNNETFQEEVAHARECTLEELKTVVDDISGFSPIVIVSGGELFLHKYWFEFLSYIKSKSLFCSIGTNGTFLEKNATKIVEMGLDDISISLDGPKATHDSIRGVSGTYEKAVRGIEKVMEEKKRLGKTKPAITVIFTITPANYRHLPEMVGLMEELGVGTLRVGHLNFLRESDCEAQQAVSKEVFGVEKDTSWSGYIMSLNGFDSAWLSDSIRGIRNDKERGIKVAFFPDFTEDEVVDYYSDGSFHSKSFKNACMVGWDTAVIGPSGEVIICPNYIIGNLCEQSFKNVWNNEKARSFRKKIAKMKELPVCSRGCCFFYT